MLAVQTNAAPPLTVESTHAIRDIFATVGTAPTASPTAGEQPVQMTLMVSSDPSQPGTPLCQLTIPAGSNMSNIVNGFGLGPLMAKSILQLNITSVPSASDALPGSDLTVTIRL
jgi:hypothetical protein